MSADLLDFTKVLKKTFDISTLYTTVHHTKHRIQLKEQIQFYFVGINFQLIILGFFGDERSYTLLKNHSDTSKKYSETDIGLLD